MKTITMSMDEYQQDLSNARKEGEAAYLLANQKLYDLLTNLTQLEAESGPIGSRYYWRFKYKSAREIQRRLREAMGYTILGPLE